jgi:hypothetical protein
MLLFGGRRLGEVVGGYVINLSSSFVGSQKNSFISILLSMQQKRRKTNTTHQQKQWFQFTRIQHKEEIARDIHKDKHTNLHKAEDVMTREVIKF